MVDISHMWCLSVEGCQWFKWSKNKTNERRSVSSFLRYWCCETKTRKFYNKYFSTGNCWPSVFFPFDWKRYYIFVKKHCEKSPKIALHYAQVWNCLNAVHKESTSLRISLKLSKCCIWLYSRMTYTKSMRRETFFFTSTRQHLECLNTGSFS